MGLFSKDPNKGWGSGSDRCVFTGAKATGTVTTVFGGRVKAGDGFIANYGTKTDRQAARARLGKTGK